jgi:hypothetical protein
MPPKEQLNSLGGFFCFGLRSMHKAHRVFKFNRKELGPHKERGQVITANQVTATKVRVALVAADLQDFNVKRKFAIRILCGSKNQ